MKELISIVKWYFGITTKEAKEYIKKASKKQIEEIKKGYTQNAKQLFYND